MRILIVDDESDQERMMKFAFRRKDSLRNFELVYATNGKSAITLLEQQQDIIIALLDINMPEMDGLTLLHLIRRSYPLVQCIIVSAYGDMTNIRTAMNRGAFDFLTKPVDLDDLENTISKTLLHYLELKESADRALEIQFLKQERSELEMQALKAQMNPHFIFNCINSIDSFILNDDKANATLYLNKFAKLFRNILDGSRQITIPLNQELQTLHLYIELELLRNNFNFDVSIQVAPDIELHDLYIPSLLLQPLVENAIQHGIRHLTGVRGKLDISIRNDTDYTVFVIQDNGVGTQKAKELRQKSTESVGLEISKSRIKNFNQEEVASFWIHDLNEEGDIKGTEVRFKLKK